MRHTDSRYTDNRDKLSGFSNDTTTNDRVKQLQKEKPISAVHKNVGIQTSLVIQINGLEGYESQRN